MKIADTDYTQDEIDEIVKNDPEMNAEYLDWLKHYPADFEQEINSEEWVQEHYEDRYWLVETWRLVHHCFD